MSTSSSPDRKSRVAVVTGGTAGIGRATARAFAAAGYDVAVLARGKAGLDAVTAEITQAGRRGLGVSVDVADVAQVRAAAQQIETELGEIAVWVNNAFAGSLAMFWDTSDEEYRRMTDVTYFGQVHGTRVALEVMRPRNRGSIVNVSSAMAYRSIPLQSAYCGAKHAIKGMTESVLTELKHEKSKVSIGLVTLPGVNTTQFAWNLNKMPEHPMPVPPVYQPEVAARAIVFAAEHPRRNMWVGVPTFYTVIGNRVAPAFVDWYLARKGVGSQQTDRGDAPRWGSNVFEPRDQDEDRGARGPFDDLAHSKDPVSFLARHREAAIATAAAGLLAAVGVLTRARS